MRKVLILCVLALSGCASLATSLKDTSVLLNQLFDQTLSPDFKGPLHINHKNPYFDFTVDVTGLHHDTSGWHWDTLIYHRSDRWTTGDLTIGSK